MYIITKCEGGAKLYGLETEESDVDIRFVFLHTDISKIIGLSRHDHDASKTEESDDSFGYELRFFLNLLKKGNSQAMEMLFNTDWRIDSPQFALIQRNKYDLFYSERLFSMLMGYINGEKRIITGQNTEKLGAKRKGQLEKFGYSYRNCVHALRLLRTGILFFRDNIYPINIVKQDKEYGQYIRDVKLNPQNYKVENLLNLINSFEADLKKHFELRSQNFIFNEKLANQICYDCYFPILKSHIN